jgi:hypothetical protein
MQDIQQRYRTAVSRTMNLEMDGVVARAVDLLRKRDFLVPVKRTVQESERLRLFKPALSKLRQKTRDEIRDVNMTDFRIESELTKLKEPRCRAPPGRGCRSRR